MTMLFFKLELTLLVFLAAVFFTEVFILDKYEDKTKLLDFISVLIWIISIIAAIVGIVTIISFIWTATIDMVITIGVILFIIVCIIGFITM